MVAAVAEGSVEQARVLSNVCMDDDEHFYGVATIGRLLKITGLFAEYRLFHRALLRKRPVILRSLLMVATPYCFLQRKNMRHNEKDVMCIYKCVGFVAAVHE